ncbi:cysteine hydrolase family protein [Streptomyces sp. NBC_01198]|uniref:cysteine hydrolase family protein n=1 Tax=Streptomyces sp. NBC_01198 TaxID=2903769 RepID=UPI002E0E8EAE|nr:cysteine hydrolase [Streptomyces sp. NBC_01198]
MTADAMPYPPGETALLLVDPYNDFLSDGGKMWPRAREVAEGVHLLDHMRAALAAARGQGCHVFIVPHHQWAQCDYLSWEYLSPTQQNAMRDQTFAQGSWGAEWHPDFQPREGEIVIRQHWSSSGFANTDLDLMLKQHRVRRIVLIGMKANTCVDTTARFGQELGYHVTLLSDAIGAFTWEEMAATFDINAPQYAHAVLTTEEFVTLLEAPPPGPASP